MLINRIPMDILPAGATMTNPADSKEFSAVAIAVLYRANYIPTVNVPVGTKRIRSYAFYDLWPNSPISVTIPEGVTTVGNCAFGNCDLESVEFPSTVKSLPSDCFKDSEPKKLIFHAPQNSVSGYPWGADNEPVIEWRG